MISWPKSKAQASKAAPKAAKTVLVIKLGELADFVQSLAAAKAIRDYHVGSRITLLTTDELKPLAENCPFFDLVEAGGRPKEPQAITQLIARIRAAKYDMVYDLEGSSRTTNYFHGLRPWPPNWSGSTPGCSHPYLDNKRDQLNPVDRYAAQLAAAGVQPRMRLTPDLTWVRPALRDAPRLQPDYFGIRGPYVLLLPRGNDSGRDRHWPENKYTELAYRIASQGVTPVVLGGAEEREVGAAIARGEPKTKNLVTRTDVFQTAVLAERSAFVVGDDVDFMQVAAAAGGQSLVFLCSTANPERATPRGKGGVVALTASTIADIPVDQVERQLRNCGVLRRTHAA